MSSGRTGGDSVSVPALERSLRGRLSDRPGLVVTSLERAVGGMSRETWFLRTADDVGGTEEFVVRADHADGWANAVPLEYEYRVYRALTGSAVPVPAALWFEHDESVIGRPFYVRAAVRGTSSPRSLFAAEPAVRERLGDRLAEILGALHTTDWRALGVADFMDVPDSPTDAVRREVERWRTFHEENAEDAEPVVADLFSWLARNLPEDVARTSLVWGDVGLGNFIVADGDIVGLTDWEYAHLDDPMKDWAAAFIRGVDRLGPRERLLERYEQVSGIAVDERNIRYHQVLLQTQYAVLAAPILRELAEREGRVDVTATRNAIGFATSCLQDAVALVDAW